MAVRAYEDLWLLAPLARAQRVSHGDVSRLTAWARSTTGRIVQSVALSVGLWALRIVIANLQA